MTPNVVWRVHPISAGKNVLVVCGPGNNGKKQQHQRQISVQDHEK